MSLALDRQLCFALYAASRAMTRAYGPLLERLGLTYPQYLVMLVLWDGDGASIKALGERLELDSGTLTPLAKRLEADGLIRRRRSADDERVVELHLTAAGRALKAKAKDVPVKLACLAGLDGPRGAERLERLRKELRELSTTLASADQDRQRD
jgi:DNA-binding MarR family transcriptional regulator